MQLQAPNITIDETFVVKEILDGERHYHALGNGLSLEGIELDTPAELLADDRFLWLEFNLPETREKIRALGEITDRKTFSVSVKFKHLFPDQRAKLARFLTPDVSMN